MKQGLVLRLVEVPAGSAEALDMIRELFEEYRNKLIERGCDFSLFQSYGEELASLPGKYDPANGGVLYLLYINGHEAAPKSLGALKVVGELTVMPVDEGARKSWGVGCIALRRFEGKQGEVKRLYVRSCMRRMGLAHELSQKIIDYARAQGYTSLLLDTLERLPEAVQLYTKLGFVRRDAYCFNPLEDVVYMEKTL